MNNLLIVGTNHLMKPEVIINEIQSFNPDIIGLELCEFRIDALLNQIKVQVKEDKSILGKITNAIKKKADESGLDYGSDQKTALNYSIENNIKYTPLDMPVVKIQELFSKIPLNEQQGFMKELMEFENQDINKEVNEEEVLKNLKLKYPIAFEFLINMRNLYITNQILKAILDNPYKKIICFIGKGHEDSIKRMLEVNKNG